jgi:Dyp-type peroxidase family
MSNLNLTEIQGIVARGYGELEAAAYLLLHVNDANPACHWLEQLRARVTTAAERPGERALNVALTYAGLQALGLHEQGLGTFPVELREGMTNAHRNRALGDHGDSAPERWLWGGPNTQAVHVLLMVFAKTDVALRAFIQELSDEFARAGVTLIGEPLVTAFLRDPASGCAKEHFGFCDALAQPFIPGMSKSDRKDREENTIEPGEFILGYANEYGLYTESPTLPAERDPESLLPRSPASAGAPDIGYNGTYIVFRQLQQHVQRFWQFLDGVARDQNGESSAQERVRLASKMVGRWPSGAALVRTPEADDTRFARDNSFDYHADDAAGTKCPLGSHVRRTNPRDSLGPGPGTPKSVAINKRHRLLRRGRAYGPPVHPSLDPHNMLVPEDGIDRGLHFICVNANISRQFEFVQQTWTNNRKFAGLYEDADPIVGDHDPHRKGELGTFTEQRDSVRRRVTGIPPFVTTRGGAYFFLPSMSALRYLAALPRLAEKQAQPMVYAR